MAVRKALVIISGAVQEMPGGDTLAGAGGGGGSLNEGFAVVDFAGTDGVLASVTVTGQANVTTTSKIQAWIAPVSDGTVDSRSVDEHLVEPLSVFAHSPVAATSFIITARCDFGVAQGKFRVGYAYA